MPAPRGDSKPEASFLAAGTSARSGDSRTRGTTQAVGTAAPRSTPRPHGTGNKAAGGVAGNGSAGEGLRLPKCSVPSRPRPGGWGCVCARAACHSSVPLFPRSYSLEFLSSVCFVSALNEQEEKGRSLDKSDQGADALRLPPAGMPSPALMRGRGERGGH